MMKSIFHRLLKQQLVKDSFWSLIGNVIGRGLALVAGILIARMLGKDVFGEYGIIKTTILTIGTFSTFGLGYTATKYVAELKKNNLNKIPIFLKTANQITLVFSGVMAVALFVFSNAIADTLLSAPQLETPLKILSVLIVFNAITTTQVGVLSGFGCFKTIAKINSLMGLLVFIFSVLLTYFYDLNGALSALLVVQVINCVMNYYFVREEVNKIGNVLVDSQPMLKEVISFSTPIALQEAIFSSTSWIASLLIIRLSSYGELGMYSAAVQWYAIVLFIPGILRNVVLSHLSNNSDNNKAHENILNQTILINVFSTMLPILAIVLLSSFIESFYGESFEGVGLLISIAVLTALFTSVSNVYSQAYMSLSKNWLMLFLKVAREASKVLIFLVIFNFLSLGGATSMIASNLICGAAYVVVMAMIYRKMIKASY